MCATANVKTMLLDFFICVKAIISSLKIGTCSYALVYIRSVSSYTTLIPKFCQARKMKMFVHMGFANSEVPPRTISN